MNLGEHLQQDQCDRGEMLSRRCAKLGEYTGDECPNCGRYRVMRGGLDSKRRCEKCHWCIEDKGYDPDLFDSGLLG